VIALLFRNATAWNAEGHMVVARIAYNHLDQAVKAKCDSLINVPVTNSSDINSNFVTAACWADDIKGSISTFNGWHFIDIPFSLDGTSTNGVGSASFDVVRTINLCISNLASSATSVSNQALYLRFLLHFVGDIQQPLHCSTAVSAAHPTGDAGGNSFPLSNANWSNLHSLWDSGGGYLSDFLSRPLDGTEAGTVSNLARTVESHYPYTPNPGIIPRPMDWASEGWNLAKTVSYVGITNNGTPTSAYLATASSTTEQRMAAGGYRLADLLNTIYSTNGVQLISVVKTNGAFRFSWNSVPGRTYKIQTKQQLTDNLWTDATNFVASTNVATFSETLVQTQRFYRAVQ
jgi:S1/P1 Nuclease